MKKKGGNDLFPKQDEQDNRYGIYGVYGVLTLSIALKRSSA